LVPRSDSAASARRAVRVDRLERLAAELRKRARSGGFVVDATLASLIACPLDAMPGVIAALGYRMVVENGVTTIHAARRRAAPGHCAAVPGERRPAGARRPSLRQAENPEARSVTVPPAQHRIDNQRRIDLTCRIDKWLWHARLVKTRSPRRQADRRRGRHLARGSGGQGRRDGPRG